LGYEIRFNWAFAVADEDEFVRAVLAGQPEPPRYFARMKRINRSGPALLGAGPRAASLPASALTSVLAQGGTVVDTRRAEDFARGAVPGTINIPANRTFTTWAGSLLSYDQSFYLIVEEGRAELVDELAHDLAGIGLDHLAGYFAGDVVDAWRESALQTIPELTLAEVVGRLRESGAPPELVLDVRAAGEWQAGHIPRALNIPLGELDQRLEEVPRDRPVLVHCQTGARAAMAASILRARGFDVVRQFPGGFAEWQMSDQPVESV
jgi:hydroxyacylglutathione hydrolase